MKTTGPTAAQAMVGIAVKVAGTPRPIGCNVNEGSTERASR